MSDLTLRAVGKDDYAVFDDSLLIGRIALAPHGDDQAWSWNISGTASADGRGLASDLEEAMWEFRKSWIAMKESTPPSQAQSAEKQNNTTK